MEEIKGINTKRACPSQPCSTFEYSKKMHCIHTSLYLFHGIIPALPIYFLVCMGVSAGARVHACTHTHTGGGSQCTHSASLYPSLILFYISLAVSNQHVDGEDGMVSVPTLQVHSWNFIHNVIWLAKFEKSWHIHIFYHLIQKLHNTTWTKSLVPKVLI